MSNNINIYPKDNINTKDNNTNLSYENERNKVNVQLNNHTNHIDISLP